MAGYEEVSTVFIGGIPPDATLREMDNLCRFMPGYVHSKVDSRKGTTLFVCFDSPDTATECIFRLDKQHFDRSNPGEPLRVVMAKSNMRSGDHPAVAQRAPAQVVYQAPPPPQALPQAPSGPQRAGKRPRMYEDPYAIDTVAIVGAADRGFSEVMIEQFFGQMPGLLAFKPNPRMGGGFAKFSAPTFAVEAVNAAVPEGIPAEIAKSSMSSAGGSPAAPQQPMPAAAHHYPGAHYSSGMAVPTPVDPWAAAQQEAIGGPKRPRIPEDPGGVDTVAIIGAEDRGFPVVAVEAFFSAIPGFVAFKPNPRMGGGFAKFASSALALEAIAVAIPEGIPVELAKSSMGTGGAGGQPPPQQYVAHSGFENHATPHAPAGGAPRRPRIPENPGCVDTVAMVGALDRGFDEETLRAFMAGCPGFVVFKANPRMGGGFAKFDSPQAASEAVAVAMAEGVPAAIAKSSMSNLS